MTSEIQIAGGFVKPGDSWLEDQGYPALSGADIAQAVTFLLTTPYSVNISEIIIKPTGESF